MPGDVVCEYAKTAQSKCKQCKEKLEKGTFRVGIYVVNPFDPDGSDTLAWYHPRCFFVHRFKQGHPTSTAKFEGFGALEKEDKKELTDLVKGGHIAKGKAEKAAPKKAAASKKKDAGSRSPSPAASKKKTAGTKRKAKAAVSSEDDEDEEEDEEDEEEDEKPAAKKAKASTKKAAAVAPSKKKAAAAAGGSVFSGLTFCLSGKFNVKKADLETRIIQAGGKVAGTVSKVVTHVASNDWDQGGDKCTDAQAKGKTCVTEKWVEKALSSGKLPAADA